MLGTWRSPFHSWVCFFGSAATFLFGTVVLVPFCFMTCALGVLFKKSLPGVRLKRLFPLFLLGVLGFPVIGFRVQWIARAFLGYCRWDPPLLFSHLDTEISQQYERGYVFPSAVDSWHNCQRVVDCVCVAVLMGFSFHSVVPFLGHCPTVLNCLALWSSWNRNVLPKDLIFFLKIALAVGCSWLGGRRSSVPCGTGNRRLFWAGTTVAPVLWQMETVPGLISHPSPRVCVLVPSFMLHCVRVCP